MPPSLRELPSDPLEAVLAYHARTKHHGAGRMAISAQRDWDHQPDPFRRYSGAELVPLEFSGAEGPGYEEACWPGAVEPRPVDGASVSQLLQDSLGLSGWKQYPGRPSAVPLRVNPSSGNLHPTEGYLLCGAVPGLCQGPGVFHYAPREHALERRAEPDPGLWSALSGDLPEGVLLVGLTTITWRESWKYGERAFRYCLLDLGHAVGAVTYAAAALGWRVRLLASVRGPEVGALLGVAAQQGQEAEEGQCLLAVGPGAGGLEPGWRPSGAALAGFTALAWAGSPNQLSAEHHPWPVIDEAEEATRSGAALPAGASAPVGERPEPLVPQARLRALVHQRRSSIDLDGRVGMAKVAFVHALEALLPDGRAPHACLPWEPQVDLGLLVHRVQGVTPGVYLLARNRDPEHLVALRSSLRAGFLWEPVEGVPGHVPLYKLQEAVCRGAARAVSCYQDIAADGAFAVVMLSAFRGPLERDGPAAYRALHWEAGLIGQALYLEAEALGLRGTGMGCFHDDPAAGEVFGLEGDAIQDLYHFTLGEPKDDPRVVSSPAYQHLPRWREGGGS
jgi:SagB-type dehydrogenase family enzyme